MSRENYVIPGQKQLKFDGSEELGTQGRKIDGVNPVEGNGRFP
jgi:hypothetical protein